MDKSSWINHLSSWKKFLTERLTIADNYGDQRKIERQLLTIERTRCAAVLNPSLLSEFINQSSVTEKHTTKEVNNYVLELNDSQKTAVNEAINRSNLCLIQGPPGTGKTQVITEICLQLFMRDPSIKILVCSETHIAVNNILSRISEHNGDIRIVRLRDKENDDQIDKFVPETIINDYLQWASASFENKDAYQIISEELADAEDKSLEKALALSANIAGMTCNRAAAYDFKDTTEMFDVAIIDEVCKATLPEILSPLLVSRKAILIGDPKQLPPVFCSEDQDVIKSIDDCKLDKYMYIDHMFRESPNTIILDTQYRMTDQIGNMISELFYDGILKNGRNDKTQHCLFWVNYTKTQDWPPKSELHSDKPHIYNYDECRIISELLSKLNNETPHAKIAVIAPYRAQAFELRKRCPKSTNVKIDTVDGFQGKESDIVIFSITRTIGVQRFLADVRRLNVALSRAKNRIYIVGELNYCNSNRIMKEIIKRSEIIDTNFNV